MNHNYARDKLSLLVRDIDHYTADEFRRQMARIISGSTGQEVPDDCHTIKAERDALAAQVETLKTAYKDLCGAINDLDETDSDSEEIIDEMWGQVFSVMQDGWNSLSHEPQQHLAEIRAEAVKTFADEIGVFSREYDDQGYVEVAKWKVQEHIAKVLAGGAE